MVLTIEREVSDYLHELVLDELGPAQAEADPAGALMSVLGEDELMEIARMFSDADEPRDRAITALYDTSESDPSWRAYSLCALIAARYSLPGANQYTLSYLQLIDSLVSSNQLDSVIANL